MFNNNHAGKRGVLLLAVSVAFVCATSTVHGQSAPINTTRSNIKKPSLKVTESESPRPQGGELDADSTRAIVTTRSNIKKPPVKVTENESPRPQDRAKNAEPDAVLMQVSTTRSKAVRGGSGNPGAPGITDQGFASNLSSYQKAPRPRDGRVNALRKVGDPIPGVGVGLEGDPPPRKVGDPIPGVEVGLEGDPQYRIATPPGGGRSNPRRTAGTPIQGTAIGLEHDPEGRTATPPKNGGTKLPGLRGPGGTVIGVPIGTPPRAR
jgi:hypothetical protein